jgi:hypothetical protein
MMENYLGGRVPRTPVGPAHEEFVVDQRTGEARQAGSDGPGEFIEEARRQMQSSLFYFAYGALGLTRLTNSLHLPVCNWLTKIPPYRKLLLLPRDHLKTSMMRSLCLHMLIQEPETNLYFPGKPGEETRILYAGETATNAEHQLSWMQSQLETNTLLRGFWPHKIWENPRKEAKRWNAKEFVLKRKLDFPESSVEAIGVGGAVTGRHYDVLAKDDLISFAAANSPVVMGEAIDWHKTSRALLDDPNRGLEVISGTHWAPGDLYDNILGLDDSVEPLVMGALEGGKPIFPEMFSLATLARLERELGPLFPLLYLNTAVDPALTDFKPAELRYYQWENSLLVFGHDERDERRKARSGIDEIIEEKWENLNEAAKEGRMGKGVTIRVR